MGLFVKSSARIPDSFVNTIGFGGKAGEGIKTAGKLICESLSKAGYELFLYDEYPSLIRGGHNITYISYSPYPVYACNKYIDILVCLDNQTFIKHKDNLSKKSIVIYDPEIFSIESDDIANIGSEFLPFNVCKEIRKNGFPSILKNTLYAGILLSILGITKKDFLASIKKINKKHAESNLKCAEIAYKISEEFFEVKKYSIEHKQAKEKKYFISGNEAIGIGALRAGLGFYSAYPMTPSSTIMDFMFKYGEKYGTIVKQAEDELSAINMVIGASFAGRRAMTATSGGGFSLMTEGLGLAAITETPIVIVLSQRPGPATGMPTWTSQSDLQFALHASQDDFPRIILAPTDHAECLYFGSYALDLSEKYQLPVIILLDKHLSESFAKTKEEIPYTKLNRGRILSDSILKRIQKFKRYEISEDGVSPRSIPGQENGVFIANSDESDEMGYSIEDSETRVRNVKKRYAKLENISKDMPDLNVYGDFRSKLALITWGSTKGAAMEAIRRLQNAGISVKLIAINQIYPFPQEEFYNLVKSTKNCLLIENNYTSQLLQFIRSQGINFDPAILTKYDGRPIYPEEIIEYLISKKII
jgi:2-oxoglutarate ferredoxin oxidoreductase subunit alpha